MDMYDAVIETTDSIASNIAGNRMILIKNTYDGTGDSGDLTFNEANTEIHLMPGATVSQKIILSAASIKILLYSGASIDDVDMDGGSGSIISYGTGIAGQIVIDSNGNTVNMGGWGNYVERVRMEQNANDNLVVYTRLNSKVPTATGTHAIVTVGPSSGAARNKFILNLISNSDDRGIAMSGVDNLVMANIINDADGLGIDVFGDRNAICANNVLNNVGDDACEIEGDDNIIAGNKLVTGGTYSIHAISTSTDCTIAYNRCPQNINNAGTGHNISRNDVSA